MAHSIWSDFVRSHKGRAKSFGLTDNFTVTEWEQLLESSDKVCMCCKKPFNEIVISADHVIPLACGGTNTIDNIQILCKDCNSNKSIRAVDYRGPEPVELNIKLLKQRVGRKSEIPKIAVSVYIPLELYQFFKDLAAKDERSSASYEIELAMREKKERIEKETPPSS